MRFTGGGKRGWDKTRLHLERGRHSFLWLSDELSKPTCKEFGAQNFKQIEIFLSPSLSVSNCPGDLTESCYTRCDFRWVVSGFNNVFIFIAIIFGCLGILKSFVVALPAEAAACTRWWERCKDKTELETEASAWSLSGLRIGPAQSSHGSPDRNTSHSHPFTQDDLWLPTSNVSPTGLHRNLF